MAVLLGPSGATATSCLVAGKTLVGYHLGPNGKPGEGFGGFGDANQAIINKNLWWGRTPDIVAENLSLSLPTYRTDSISVAGFTAGQNVIVDTAVTTGDRGRQIWATDGSLPFHTYIGPSSTAGNIHLSSNPSTQVNVTTLKAGNGPLYVFSSSPFTSRLGNYAGWTGSPMLISMVPFPQTYTNSNGVSTSGRWQDVPTGAFDGMYRAAGLQLVASGRGDAVIRIAIEADGSWFYWALQQPNGSGGFIYSPAQFKAGFAYMSAVLKQTPGSAFSIEYNCAEYNGWDPNVSMPDPSSFDLVGRDTYDEGAFGTSYPVSDHVSVWANEIFPHLEVNRKMADTVGKPLSLSEYSGSVTRQDGHGGGDDPYFLTQTAAYCNSHNVGALAYFDAYDGTQASRTQNNCLSEPVSPYTGSHGPFGTADGSQTGSNSAVNAAAVWRGPLFAQGALGFAAGGGGGGTTPPASATISAGRTTRYSGVFFGGGVLTSPFLAGSGVQLDATTNQWFVDTADTVNGIGLFADVNGQVYIDDATTSTAGVQYDSATDSLFASI